MCELSIITSFKRSNSYPESKTELCPSCHVIVHVIEKVIKL